MNPKKTKQAIFESLLIPVEVRLPAEPRSESEQYQVLLRLESGKYSVSPVVVFLAQQKQLQAGCFVDSKKLEGLQHSGYFATHWMRLY